MPDLVDPAPPAPDTAPPVPAVLADAVGTARAAAVEEADGDAAQVGEHVTVRSEAGDPLVATHRFVADRPGYRGWFWAVTVVDAGDGGPDSEPTVSEVVLLPGDDAITAPSWLPWNERVRAEDLNPGDLLPVEADDERLVPAHAVLDEELDDASAQQVRTVADELGLGRARVLGPEGRLDAAVRWSGGDFGPGAEMARQASANCGTCGFYLTLDSGLRAAFGVCGNGQVPADGRVVHVEYGCGGHSELQVDTGSLIAVADLVYDDGVDMEPVDGGPAIAAETAGDQDS